MRIYRLELNRFEMSLRERRYLQYFSCRLGLSEIDLSKVIGVSGGSLVFGGKEFGAMVDAGSVLLVNDHMLTAKIGGVKTWLDLNGRIRTVDEVLRYSEEGYGSADEGCICCSWRFREFIRESDGIYTWLSFRRMVLLSLGIHLVFEVVTALIKVMKQAP